VTSPQSIFVRLPIVLAVISVMEIPENRMAWKFYVIYVRELPFGVKPASGHPLSQLWTGIQ